MSPVWRRFSSTLDQEIAYLSLENPSAVMPSWRRILKKSGGPISLPP